MKNSFAIDNVVFGRISPKHISLELSNISQITIICLEEEIPLDIENRNGVKIIHCPFPKVQTQISKSDWFLAKSLVQRYGNTLENCLENNETILIHCGRGNDRTGLMIMYYLCVIKGVEFDVAFNLLKSKNPNALTYGNFSELASWLFNQNKEHETDFVLRVSATNKCQMMCEYCDHSGSTSVTELPTDELIYILQAAYEAGINKIHWTGGEPTVRKDFLNIVSACKEIGFTYQKLTTNGARLKDLAKPLKNAGIDRVNVSLDTLKEDGFNSITNTKLFRNVTEGINEAIKVFNTVKINVCIVKDNFVEIADFIRFSQVHDTKLILKFLELVPCGNKYETNPTLFSADFVSVKQIKQEIISKFGEVIIVSKATHSRQKCEYYEVENNGVQFGLNPNHSINYKCQQKRCVDMRLSPTGFVSDCSIRLDNVIDISQTNYPDTVKAIKSLINKKRNRSLAEWKTYRHKQRHYGFWRFGDAKNTQGKRSILRFPSLKKAVVL